MTLQANNKLSLFVYCHCDTFLSGKINVLGQRHVYLAWKRNFGIMQSCKSTSLQTFVMGTCEITLMETKDTLDTH